MVMMNGFQYVAGSILFLIMLFPIVYRNNLHNIARFLEVKNN